MHTSVYVHIERSDATTGSEAELLAYCDQLREIGELVVDIDLDKVVTVDHLESLYHLIDMGKGGENMRMSRTACIVSESRIPSKSQNSKDCDQRGTLLVEDAITQAHSLDQPFCAHTAGPMFLELNPFDFRFSLILQCLKRVHAISEHHGGIYCSAVCFAVTNDARYCYLITYSYRLSIDDYDKNDGKKFYRIHLIKRADVGKLWLMFANTPEFFHAKDGGAIVSVLR